MKIEERFRKIFGNEPYQFQKQSIEDILDGFDSLVVAPTGKGKSACFIVSGLELQGITLIIEPTIAIIEDQQQKISELLEPENIKVVSVYSGTEDKETLKTFILGNKDNLKFIITTPESLRANKDFFQMLDISLIAVDEAHCITGYGNGFRPDYRLIGYLAEYLKKNDKKIPVMALTATAGSRTVDDIVSNLFMNIRKRNHEEYTEKISKTPNIERHIEIFGTYHEKHDALIDFIVNNAEKKGIVFCQTIRETENLYEEIKRRFPTIRVGKYHGRMKKKNKISGRDEAFRRFRNSELKIMIATSAFGMGIDIKDIEFVLHSSVPLTTADYIQQCGRAGRNENIKALLVMYISFYDVVSAAMLIRQQPFDMYTVSEARSKREYNFAEFFECLGILTGYAENDEETKQMFLERSEKLKYMKYPEDSIDLKNPQMLVFSLSKLSGMVRSGIISAYQEIIAEAVYTLYYYGCSSFTVRRIARLISGNDDVNMRRKDKKYTQIQEELAFLIKRKLVPAEESSERQGFYTFRKYNSEMMVNAFRIFKSEIKTDFIKPMKSGIVAAAGRNSSESERKKRIDEDRDFTVIKFYILRSIARMSPIRKKSRKKHRVSYSIIYLRYDRNFAARNPDAGKTTREEKFTGLLEYGRFECTEQHVHNMTVRILENLKESGYIKNFWLIPLSKYGGRKEWKGIETDEGVFAGVRIYL